MFDQNKKNSYEAVCSFFAWEAARSLKPRSSEEHLLLASLWDHTDRGHLCLGPKSDLLRFAPHEKQLEKLIDAAEEYLSSSYCAFPSTRADFPALPLCFWKGSLYLQRNWIDESRIIRNIRRLISAKSQNFLDLPDTRSALFETLDAQQRQALLQVWKSPFSLIFGGPGTGKSYTIVALLELFLRSHPDAQIAVTAPTGKAVHQLSLRIGRVGGGRIVKKTLHALLGMKKDGSFPSSLSPLPYDLIVADESSMIGAHLMGRFLESIREKSRLILVGDPHQLPSVDAGSVFHDFKHTPLQATYLEKAKRFETRDLSVFVSMLEKPDQVNFREFFEKSASLHFLSLDKISHPDTTVCTLLSKYLEQYSMINNAKSAFAFLARWQILATHIQGPFGVAFFNQHLLEYVSNLRKKVLYLPIITTENNYVKSLYNGTLGVCVRHVNSPEKDHYLFQEGKDLRELPAQPLGEKSGYLLAFCLSVHKSQGSEFDHVLLSLGQESASFGKKILYTAATRAKKSLQILGKEQAFSKILEQDSWRDSLIQEEVASL